jgi:hypothetical protein
MHYFLFFVAVETIQELFALLVLLLGMLMRFLDLLILAMRLHKRGSRGDQVAKSGFDGRKNLLLKVNAMHSTSLDIAAEMEKDARTMWKEQKRTFWLPLSLDMCMRWFVGELFGNDPQRFVWFGRVAAANGNSQYFLNEMVDQIRDFNSGVGHATVVFVVGRALKGHVDNEKGTIFGRGYNFDTYIGPANQALHCYEFQLQSYRKAVDSWTIVGLRNRVVKDIRKLIGKMIWDAREYAEFEQNCSAVCQCPFCVMGESGSSEQSSDEDDDEHFDD